MWYCTSIIGQTYPPSCFRLFSTAVSITGYHTSICAGTVCYVVFLFRRINYLITYESLSRKVNKDLDIAHTLSHPIVSLHHMISYDIITISDHIVLLRTKFAYFSTAIFPSFPGRRARRGPTCLHTTAQDASFGPACGAYSARVS